MPFYPDGHLARHRLTDEQYVSALQQILLGLNHLHGHGITHRDLKPENLLIDKDNDPGNVTIIIADFGLSKMVTPMNNLLSTFCGTLMYTAPDVFPRMSRKSQGYGPKVDIWSTGIIILDMYGLPKPPTFPNKDDSKQQEAAMERWVRKWTKLLLKKLEDEDEDDDKLIGLLFHMIDPDPEKRYSAEKCLQMGYCNGLFNAAPTLEDDRVKTPTPQSPHLSETGNHDSTLGQHEHGKSHG